MHWHGYLSDGCSACMASRLVDWHLQKDRNMLDSLRQYWEHQLKLLRGYEKNPAKLDENVRIIEGWIGDIVRFLGD